MLEVVSNKNVKIDFFIYFYLLKYQLLLLNQIVYQPKLLTEF